MSPLPPAHQPVIVAHLGPDPADPGGMPAVLARLMASPLGSTHRLVVIPTHRVGGMLGRIAIFARALALLVGFCLRPGARVVHLHVTVRGSMYRKAIAAAVARALRRPIVLHVHAGALEIAGFDAALDPVRRAAFAWTFRRAARVIAVSAASAREVESRFGADSVEVLPNAAPDPVPGALGREPPAPGRARVLYLGGFADPVKGGAVLVDALPQLLAAAPEVRVTLAGPGQPPEALRSLAQRDERVVWAGWLDAVAKDAALREADLFVLPSTSEGLPVALLEAMAYGKPVVATRVGGVPDVVADRREGVLIASGDAAALADALAALVADPSRARALARGALARVASLGTESVSARLDALYREVAA